MWADFMTRATALPEYREAKDFIAPEGIQSVVIDPESLELATPNCPNTRSEVYVNGSGPTEYCEIHGGHGVLAQTGSFLSHVFGGGDPKPPETQIGADGKPVILPQRPNPPAGELKPTGEPGSESTQPAEKKKNPLQKIFGIFGGKKKDPDKAKPNPEKGDSP